MKRWLMCALAAVCAAVLLAGPEACEAKCRCGTGVRHKVKTRCHAHHGKEVRVARCGACG